MTPGMVGYFPEGTSYGPQTSEGTATTFVLQFGGSSGQGYLSRQEVKQGMDALRYDRHVRRRHLPAQRRRARQAQHGRLPGDLGARQRTAAAVSEAPLRQAGDDGSGGTTNGSPSADQPGVYEKLLGVFTERRSEAGIVLVNAGATLTGTGRGLFRLSRRAAVDGKPLRPLTTVFLERGEKASFTAERETEFLHFGLPDLRGLSSKPVLRRGSRRVIFAGITS